MYHQLNIILIFTICCLISQPARSAPATDLSISSVTGELSPSTTTAATASEQSPVSSTPSPIEPAVKPETDPSLISVASTTTTTSTSTTTQGPITTLASSEQVSVTTTSSTSSAPATDSLKEVKSTSPMSSGGDLKSHRNGSILEKSNFTCYGKNLGYYADIEEDCKVYHFCLLGEYSGDSVYQRISYKCLNDTYFDQQALDCVDQSKMSSPCGESYLFYESSNVILRQAVVDTNVHQNTNATTN